MTEPKNDPEGQRCYRCGKALPSGSLTYVAEIRIFAGFDGVLIEPEEGVEVQLRRLIRQAEQMEAEELEKEVYQEFHLVLCPSCRDRLVREIEHPWGLPAPMIQ
ncbi:MAG: hypothetical protein N3G78_12320 [Desulfobacterota bacterium]|nr:hypothetical protein [Thermodesulfobacteriota bacterium]